MNLSFFHSSSSRSASAAARSDWLELSAISCSSGSEMGPPMGVEERRRREDEPFSARLDQGEWPSCDCWARKRRGMPLSEGEWRGAVFGGLGGSVVWV